jgi:hypothetical protein
MTAQRPRIRLPRGVSRGLRVAVTIDGRATNAFLGESVAAALLAEGHVSTRTTVGGEPRGVFCGMGVCFDCLVIVDGVPNTRACVTWVYDGIDIARQHGAGYPLDEGEPDSGNAAS